MMGTRRLLRGQVLAEPIESVMYHLGNLRYCIVYGHGMGLY